MYSKFHTDDIESLIKKVDDLKQAMENLLEPPDRVIIDDVDLCDRLKVSKRTTADWRKEGIITFSKIGGKIFYTLSNVLQMIKENEIPAVSTNLKIAL